MKHHSYKTEKKPINDSYTICVLVGIYNISHLKLKRCDGQAGGGCRLQPPERSLMAEMESSARKRLFVDMDGTLAEFKPVDTLETLYEKGYFENLEPQTAVVDAVRIIVTEHPEIEVNILSSVLKDSPYAIKEKNAWLDKYLPEIDIYHRIYPPCGRDKKDFVKNGVTEKDFLLDDYTANLSTWEPPARGIKILNGINHTKGTWAGEMVSHEQKAEQLAEDIINRMSCGAYKREKIQTQHRRR